jgi:hypothetical protein
MARALPCPVGNMTRTRAAVALVLLVLALMPVALAADSPRGPGVPHIRTTDARLRRLVREGVRTSETFRALVERLDRSDVVVYLDCDGAAQRRGGRLAFISAAGGYRYVQVRVTQLRSTDEQIAIIGHELQHAVEIADAPAVVDARSMADEYARIGYVHRRAAGAGLSFDSDAAVRAGYRVLHEVTGGMGD